MRGGGSDSSLVTDLTLPPQLPSLQPNLRDYCTTLVGVGGPLAAAVVGVVVVGVRLLTHYIHNTPLPGVIYSQEGDGRNFLDALSPPPPPAHPVPPPPPRGGHNGAQGGSEGGN